MQSSEGALKQFIFSTFISSLLFYSTSYIYFYLNTMEIFLVNDFISQLQQSEIIFALEFAMIIYFVAFAFKMGAFPAHQSFIDTYESMPIMTLNYVLSLPKISYITTFYTIFNYVFVSFTWFEHICFWCGIISMV